MFDEIFQSYILLYLSDCKISAKPNVYQNVGEMLTFTPKLGIVVHRFRHRKACMAAFKAGVYIHVSGWVFIVYGYDLI